MTTHFSELLQSVVSIAANGGRAIRDPGQRRKSEGWQAIWNAAKALYPEEATIADLFEAQAAQHPDRDSGSICRGNDQL